VTVEARIGVQEAMTHVTPTMTAAGGGMAAAVDELRRLAGPMFAAVDRSGMAVLVTDPRRPGNPIVFVNEAFKAYTGYSADEAVGRNPRFLQGPGTDTVTLRRLAEAVSAAREIEVEILNYRKDGSPFWQRLFISPLFDEEANLAFFFGSQVDVTAAHDAQSNELKLRLRQRELDEANERLRITLELSGAAAAWEWRIPEGRLVGDARFAALYGLDPRDAATGVEPRLFFSIIHPDDRARIRLAVGGMLRGAEVFAKEYRLVLADGSMRWVQARGRCNYDEAEQPTRFIGALIDITEQKRVEEQLRIAQTAGGVGTFQYIDGFGTVSVSTQFCQLLGLHPASDLPVRTVNAVVHPQDAPIIDRAADPVAGTVGHVEFRIRRPDNGETRWLMRRGEHVRDAETAGLRFVGVIYDITEAKRTEEQLRTLNETLETRVEERTRERDRLWRLSRDPFLIAATDGTWLNINPVWTELLGWQEDEIVGRTSEWMEHSDDRGKMRAECDKLAAGGSTQRFENRLRTKAGAYRWFSWTAVRESDLLYFVGRDVTVEKERAAALILTEERLRQSQKMEAVGQLTGGLAHDFNNLLTGIMGSLELLKSRVAEGRLGSVNRYIGAAQGEAARAAALTHRLLAFSRRQTLDPRATEVNKLVAGMQELVQRTVGPAIEVNAVLAPGLWLTLCDPNQLESALLNLCINARDAMADGGRLTIETANVSLDERAREDDMAPGHYVMVAVTDSGTGMLPEVAARAFDPFFTTKPLGQGTGLGLSMIYGFAKQSGGQVAIETAVGKGSTIRIHLPRHLGAAEGEPRAPDLAEAPRAELGQSVLVVDDEPTVRMLVTEVLEELGYAALEAADGPSGLAALQSDARVDLLITDVGLPGGMNGRQLADAARVNRPDLRILFITGYAENAVMGSGQLEPGMHVMTKPFAMEALAIRIKAILMGSA
jgi:PAS domain S-box-containing protein